MTLNSNFKKYIERDRRGKKKAPHFGTLTAFSLHFHFPLGPANSVTGPVLTSHAHPLSSCALVPSTASTFTTHDARSLLWPHFLPSLSSFPPALPFHNQEQESHFLISPLTFLDKFHLLSQPPAFSWQSGPQHSSLFCAHSTHPSNPTPFSSCILRPWPFTLEPPETNPSVPLIPPGFCHTRGGGSWKIKKKTTLGDLMLTLLSTSLDSVGSPETLFFRKNRWATQVSINRGMDE